MARHCSQINLSSSLLQPKKKLTFHLKASAFSAVHTEIKLHETVTECLLASYIDIHFLIETVQTCALAKNKCCLEIIMIILKIIEKRIMIYEITGLKLKKIKWKN